MTRTTILATLALLEVAHIVNAARGLVDWWMPLTLPAFFAIGYNNDYESVISDGRRVRIDPASVYSIDFPANPSNVALVQTSGETYAVDIETAASIETAMADPDPRLLSDDALQAELEFAERRHTRLLAEVARRSP